MHQNAKRLRTFLIFNQKTTDVQHSVYKQDRLRDMFILTKRRIPRARTRRIIRYWYVPIDINGDYVNM